MTQQQLSEHRETALAELITHWVCMGGAGAVPNSAGASITNYWMVTVYEQLMKMKGQSK